MATPQKVLAKKGTKDTRLKADQQHNKGLCPDILGRTMRLPGQNGNQPPRAQGPTRTGFPRVGGDQEPQRLRTPRAQQQPQRRKCGLWPPNGLCKQVLMSPQPALSVATSDRPQARHPQGPCPAPLPTAANPANPRSHTEPRPTPRPWARHPSLLAAPGPAAPLALSWDLETFPLRSRSRAVKACQMDLSSSSLRPTMAGPPPAAAPAAALPAPRPAPPPPCPPRTAPRAGARPCPAPQAPPREPRFPPQRRGPRGRRGGSGPGAEGSGSCTGQRRPREVPAQARSRPTAKHTGTPRGFHSRMRSERKVTFLGG